MHFNNFPSHLKWLSAASFTSYVFEGAMHAIYGFNRAKMVGGCGCQQYIFAKIIEIFKTFFCLWILGMQSAVLSLQTPTKVSGRIIFGKRGFIFNGKKDIYNIYYSDVLPRHIHIVWNLYHTEDCRVLYHQNAVPKMIFIEIFNACLYSRGL